MKKVFVSGCFDLLHSGHIEFFRQASRYGKLYVGIGSDATIEEYKGHKPLYCEKERLFMVKAVRYVEDALVNPGSGVMDFVPSLDIVKPDILVVNSEGSNIDKKRICLERGIEYVVLDRVPADGLQPRSSSSLKHTLSAGSSAARTEEKQYGIPTRLDLAGTWIDQPYVSEYKGGWAITISLEPTFEVRERCGLSTSTRNQIKKIWPVALPDMDPEMLARLVFCFENHPERPGGHVSGAQDAIGICVPGLCRHYYRGHFWPEKIEKCSEASILWWLEQHLCLIPLEPRAADCSVVKGKDVNFHKVVNLTDAAERCWRAILSKDLDAFAKAFADSFNAQTAMFPAMIQGCVQGAIDHWSRVPGVLAWKMPGAGGGGYLALVVEDADGFCGQHDEAIPLKIRRP